MCKIINTIFILLALTVTGQRSTANAAEILIGYFGPGTSTHPQAGDMFSAASLAIEQANLAGGYNGIPFRLVTGWSDNPWGSGVKEVVRMAYEHKVRAIIGGIDGASTHLAEQVVAKAQLTLLSPASTDKSVNLANVPWMFSAIPGDNIQAPVLADAISSSVADDPFVLISATDHDSHLFTVELKKSFVKHRINPRYHFEFKPGEKDFTVLLDKLIPVKAQALIIIAGAEDSSILISAVRENNFRGLIFGGPFFGRRRFLEKAGQTAEGVIFPLLYMPGERAEYFEKQFSKRFGKRPDYLAAHTYDTVNLLVYAIKKAGLDRAKIRDTVKELSSWNGVTGAFNWNAHGANTREVQLGTITNGRVVQLKKLKLSFH